MNSKEITMKYTLLTGEMAGLAISQDACVFSLHENDVVQPFRSKKCEWVVNSVIDKRRVFSVKELLYTAYRGNVPEGYSVSVINGKEDDLFLENLGLASNTKRGRGRSKSLSKEDVLDIRKEYYLNNVKPSVLAAEYEVTTPTIHSAVHAKNTYKDTAEMGILGFDIDDIVVINNPKTKTHNHMGSVHSWDNKKKLIYVDLGNGRVVGVRFDKLIKAKKKQQVA